jgi:hypothetical protein
LDSPEVTPARGAEPDPVVEPTPSSPTAIPSPTTRRRKAAEPRQAGLDLEAETVAELLEAHRLARALVASPPWPAKTSKGMASMRAGCRKAVETRGVEWCRAMLAWRAGEWAEKPSEWPYSTTDVWRPSCLDYAKRAMASAGQAQARESPAKRRGSSWIDPIEWSDPGDTEHEQR